MGVRSKTFKKVLVSKEHCHKCQEQLRGDGSMGLPWRCSCGVWKWDWKKEEYYVESKDE